MMTRQYLWKCDLCGIEVITSPPLKQSTDPVPIPLDWAVVRFDTKDRLNVQRHVCNGCRTQIKYSETSEGAKPWTTPR